MTTLIVDTYLTGHTTSTCPEFHAPAVGSAPDDCGLVICADCEVAS